MVEKHRMYSVNWIDGMKINKDHFISMENAMIYRQHVINKSLITPYNFGILPGFNGESALEISFEVNAHNHVDIKVNRCMAITSGGFIMDLDTETSEFSDFQISLNNFDVQTAEGHSGVFYIMLKILPYARMPIGNADPKENPPRHPYVIPEYSVSIIPVEQMNKAGFGDFYQVIGKLHIKENVPQLDKHYIPPCSKVSSDSRLLKMESDLLSYFSKLELDIMVIIRKIHMKEHKSPLATSVLLFADEIATFQGLQITKQRLYLKHSPPVALFEAVSQFARLMRNTLDTLTPETKEKMINYFSDWCNLKQGELEKLILDTVNFDYNHYEIAAVMSKLMTFMQTMSLLFETVSHLDYVGKRRDTNIYIKEEEKPKRSFLAED
ncbi:hypothetical protein [Sediminicola luteus]|uniref:Type VI secretion system-associated protein n=1 Tax=Sediminicola luteus TaxID=319238 RepID=A0ABV2TYG0_9FLAO